MAETTPKIPQYSNARWIMISVALFIVLLFLWTVRNVLMLGLMAIIVVIGVTIPVKYLVRIKIFGFGINRTMAIILTFIGVIAFVGLMVALVLPTVVSQFEELGDIIGQGTQNVIDSWNSGEIQEEFPILQDLNLEESFDLESADIQDLARQGLTALGSLGGSVLPVFGGIANTVLSTLIVLFLSLYLLASPKTYSNGFISLAPLWYRHRVRHILERLHRLLRRWIFATATGMIITGVGTFIGLTIVGIEQAAALAILTALFSFVPTFGELLSVIVALVVGVVQAPESLLWIAVVIYGVSFVQGQIIGPLLASESVEIPPVLILMGQIIVGGFFGVTGIVLAVPIMAIFMVIIQEVYIIDILGDRSGGKDVAIEENTPHIINSSSRFDEESLMSDGV